MSTKQKIQVEILSLLNQLPVVAERIEIIERIGKRLRQANSIETAKEVQKFVTKSGLNKKIDKYEP
jgi:hypothetical protein